jgi:glycosyltransferase involved in cell wall biosynthesis
MMKSLPRVSVITPLYNGERFIEATIRSVLDQSFSDFEYVIVDDGSTDMSVQIVEGFSDGRILLKKAEHRGCAETYNECLASARGGYIAIIDHDDIMHRDRLKKQAEYLDSHPDVDILGSAYGIMDESGNLVEERSVPVGCGNVRRLQRVFNAVAHQTVMMRRGVLSVKPWYRREYEPAHDTEWLTRLSMDRVMDNIPERLTDWRVVGSSPTHTQAQEQMRIHYAVRREVCTERYAGATASPVKAECAIDLGRIEYYDGNGARALKWFVRSLCLAGPSLQNLRYIAGCLAWPAVLLSRRFGIARRMKQMMNMNPAGWRYFAP